MAKQDQTPVFYDATGNRLSYSQPAVTQSYSYPSNSHRLDAINGASRSYTAAGNTSAVNGLSLDYSGFNRLSRVANSGLDLQRAHYNGRGEREHRWTASAPRYFGYDESGRLLFEGDSNTGALRQLFVWLDDQPVALLPQAGAYAGEVLHVHADHLGSPRVVTRPAAGNATVWRWALEGSAFGQHPAEADVDGDGVALEFNLRYPGQYYDSATGWHYNYFRDYEPGVGRYVQSDPIGLKGGVSTYAYVGGRPLSYIDPLGLRARTCCKRIPRIGLFGKPHHCYIEIERGGTTTSYGLVGGRFSGQPFATGNIYIDNPFDADGECGPWNEDCDTDECVLSAAHSYANPSDYHYLNGSNSNSFAGNVSRQCNLKKPDVDGTTPRWGAEPAEQKPGTSYRPPTRWDGGQ